MALGTCTTQWDRRVNSLVYPTEQDELAGAQRIVEKSDVGSDKAFIFSEALTSLQASTLSLIPPSVKD